jgi:Putative Actinobacterial Holin-X, holin superfamily III
LAKDDTLNLGERIELIAHDAERLVGLHAELLRSEIRQSAAQATPALTNIGVGAGLAIAGGLIGSLAVVHALHRFTRLPLWGCYGLVGGLLGAAGAGLVGSGVRQISGVHFIPYETLATLKEDLEWVKGKAK